MYWSNYHSHCTFCDGRSSMEDFVRYAISKGLKKYGFSSHAPLPFHTQWTMVHDDFQDYENEFYRLKEKYNNEIELYLGLEVDYISGCSDIYNDFFKGIKLDYSIGSVHYLDRLANNDYWSIDGPFDEFDKGLHEFFDGDIVAGTHRFFEVTHEMIHKAGFDIIGHVDKITYHGRKYKDFDVNAKWFVDAFYAILETIKTKGLLLEINTKSLHDHAITYPNQHFYHLIKELDIPIMVNSDCHYPNNVNAGFEQTYLALKKCGFTSLQQLSGSGWQAVEFNENGLIF